MNEIVLTSALMNFLFILIGLVFWKVQLPPNSLVGIRTTKTLNNEKLWHKTNRRVGLQLTLLNLVGLLILGCLYLTGIEFDKSGTLILIFTNTLILGPIVETLFWLRKQQ